MNGGGGGRGVIALGALVVVGMLILLAREISFASHAQHATGTIVSTSRSANDRAWHPVEFPTVDFPTPGTGIVVEFGNTYGSRYRWNVGDSVPVLYDPDDPTRAEIDSFDRWLTPILGAGAGLVIAAEGLRRNARA